MDRTYFSRYQQVHDIAMNNYSTQITQDEIEQNTEYIRWKRARTTKYLLSAILAFAGIVILASQLGPLTWSYIQGLALEAQHQSIKDPTSAQEINPQDADLPYYDPGVSYFQNLIQHIGPQGVVAGATTTSHPQPQQNCNIDESYSQIMTLDIPSLNLQNIPISPNVDSFNEEVYNEALKKGLAHFKGTPLPGDGCNSFIYGHSAVESWFDKNPDVLATVFSSLEGIEVADNFTIHKDGNILEYTVQKKKIAEPDDFDVISGIPNKETVTLMTCWPLGIGSKRLVIIGERTDGG